jgi:hypothetical protein
MPNDVISDKEIEASFDYADNLVDELLEQFCDTDEPNTEPSAITFRLWHNLTRELLEWGWSRKDLRKEIDVAVSQHEASDTVGSA